MPLVVKIAYEFLANTLIFRSTMMVVYNYFLYYGILACECLLFRAKKQVKLINCSIFLHACIHCDPAAVP